jgi:hypothetical protein
MVAAPALLETTYTNKQTNTHAAAKRMRTQSELDKERQTTSKNNDTLIVFYDFY